MVKIHMENNHAEIAFEGGNPLEVGADLATAISGIYQGIKNASEAEANVFKVVMQQAMADDSPVWSHEHNMTIVSLGTKK